MIHSRYPENFLEKTEKELFMIKITAYKTIFKVLGVKKNSFLAT